MDTSDRINNAEEALIKYLSGGDEETAVIDILTDLRHYCDHYAVEFNRCLRMSESHFEVERR